MKRRRSEIKRKRARKQISPRDVDWNAPLAFDVDLALAEAIRARSALKQITLRVGEDQIAEARRVAARTGVSYQTILRRWLAKGASLSRSLRSTG